MRMMALSQLISSLTIVKNKVVFGAYKGAIESKEILNCKKDTFTSDRDMDLAVFELDKNPSEKYTPIEFAADNL